MKSKSQRAQSHELALWNKVEFPSRLTKNTRLPEGVPGCTPGRGECQG